MYDDDDDDDDDEREYCMTICMLNKDPSQMYRYL
jgi:hypothetical protein